MTAHLTKERIADLRMLIGLAQEQSIADVELREVLDAYEALAAERDRYRAALEAVTQFPATLRSPHKPMGYSRNMCGCSDCYAVSVSRAGADKAADIARRALAGDKKETKLLARERLLAEYRRLSVAAKCRVHPNRDATRMIGAPACEECYEKHASEVGDD